MRLESYIVNSNDKENRLICLSDYQGRVPVLTVLDGDTLKNEGEFAYPDMQDGFVRMSWAYVPYVTEKIVVFVPRWWVLGNHVALYDLVKETYKYIPIEVLREPIDNPDCLKETDFWVNNLRLQRTPKFSEVYQYGGVLFCTPSSYPGILKIDLEKGNASCIDIPVQEILRLSKRYGKIESYPFGFSVRVNNKLYLTCRYADLLVEFDMAAETSRVILLNTKPTGNFCIQTDGENLWLFDKNTFDYSQWNLAREEISSGRCECSPELPEIFALSSRMSYCNGKIFFKMNGDVSLPLSLDMETCRISVADDIRQCIAQDDYLNSLWEMNGKLYFSTHNERIGAYSLASDGYYEKPLLHSKVALDVLFKRYYGIFANRERFPMVENEILGLLEFAYGVPTQSEETNDNVTGYGKQIYERVMKEVAE